MIKGTGVSFSQRPSHIRSFIRVLPSHLLKMGKILIAYRAIYLKNEDLTPMPLPDFYLWLPCFKDVIRRSWLTLMNMPKSFHVIYILTLSERKWLKHRRNMNSRAITFISASKDQPNGYTEILSLVILAKRYRTPKKGTKIL